MEAAGIAGIRLGVVKEGLRVLGGGAWTFSRYSWKVLWKKGMQSIGCTRAV